ncbi:hypothetical protein LCGC14_2030630 [marine sediment metagenome]|uniref:PilZ domain-containing protein n=1 Tax=marine sediment metagenome TaxID=412755 RepID=A0A0F9FHD8_9ZZZZ
MHFIAYNNIYSLTLFGKGIVYIAFMNDERRASERLERSLPISLLSHGHMVKLKNISPEGVYFEVITNDVNNYALGKEIMVYIEPIPSIYMGAEGSVCITGFGKVVRVEGIDITNHDKKLGVALKFSEELKVCV